MGNDDEISDYWRGALSFLYRLVVRDNREGRRGHRGYPVLLVTGHGDGIIDYW